MPRLDKISAMTRQNKCQQEGKQASGGMLLASFLNASAVIDSVLSVHKGNVLIDKNGFLLFNFAWLS